MTDLFAHLIDLQQQAFTDQFYNTAYHLLAAALHCAVDHNNVHQVLEVERLANEQLLWIDANRPAYEHSTVSAHARGHDSIYTMLARQANARALILKHQGHKSPLPVVWPGDGPAETTTP